MKRQILIIVCGYTGVFISLYLEWRHRIRLAKRTGS